MRTQADMHGSSQPIYRVFSSQRSIAVNIAHHSSMASLLIFLRCVTPLKIPWSWWASLELSIASRHFSSSSWLVMPSLVLLPRWPSSVGLWCSWIAIFAHRRWAVIGGMVSHRGYPAWLAPACYKRLKTYCPDGPTKGFTQASHTRIVRIVVQYCTFCVAVQFVSDRRLFLSCNPSPQSISRPHSASLSPGTGQVSVVATFMKTAIITSDFAEMMILNYYNNMHVYWQPQQKKPFDLWRVWFWGTARCFLPVSVSEVLGPSRATLPLCWRRVWRFRSTRKIWKAGNR